MTQKNINWKAMHQHLANTQQQIDKNFTCSIEQTNKMLHERANELAKKFIISTDKHEGVEIIEFRLGSEHYGIEFTYVTQVFETKNITSLPGTPEFIEGIVNVHGNIICVINLKEFFGLPKLALNDLKCIVIINHDDIKLGILVDAVIGIESIVLNTIQKSLPTLTGIRSKFLTGITHDQKIILNIPKLMVSKELIINDSI